MWESFRSRDPQPERRKDGGPRKDLRLTRWPRGVLLFLAKARGMNRILFEQLLNDAIDVVPKCQVSLSP